MKKFITGLVIFAALTTGIAHAGNIEVVNPEMDLQGKTVTMKAEMTGNFPQPEIKVLFHGSTSGFSETSDIQPYYAWWSGLDIEKTNLKEMYANGWRLIQMTPYNANAAKQFYLIFQK